MMTIQARELLRPYPATTHALRAYPTDSPRAKARLIALALLADGRLAVQELEALDRRGMFRALGLTREDFFQVLFDFCSDVVHLPSGAGNYVLPPETVTGLFGEIGDAQDRRALLQLIAEVIGSDGELADGEEALFRQAVEHWQVGLDEPSHQPLGTRHARSQRQAEHYFS